MQRQLYKTKNTDKIKDLVNVIKSGLVDLENKIEEISENEIVSEKLYDIVNTNKFFYKFTDKLNLKKQNKYVVLANLSIYYTWKNIKYACKNNIYLKYLLQLGMMNLIYLMDHIIFQIFQIILNTLLKCMRL